MKKNTILVVLLLIIIQNAFSQGIGINADGTLPDNRVGLDVNFTNKGVLLPRLTDTQRDELYQNVPEGMIIYNTSDKQLQIFMDNQWYPLSMGTPENAPASGSIVDGDGNTYNSVIIGTQEWLSENLKTTKYNNGNPIPLVETNWENTNTPAYCWYDNNSANGALYGALYNWYVIDPISNGNRNACPQGWHVPTQAEWTTLTTYLTNNGYGYGGSGSDIGKSLAATTTWGTYNTLGTVGNDPASNNSSGFTGLAAGGRADDGTFYYQGIYAFWWISTVSGAWDFDITYYGDGAYQNIPTKQHGYSIRCLKN